MNNLSYVRDIMKPVCASQDKEESPGLTCVLGILSTHLDEETSQFPNIEEGKNLLIELGVPNQYVQRLAEEIIEANDSYDFHQAWWLLDLAHRLVYREFRRKQRRKHQPWISWATWAGEEGFVPATTTEAIV